MFEGDKNKLIILLRRDLTSIQGQYRCAQYYLRGLPARTTTNSQTNNIGDAVNGARVIATTNKLRNEIIVLPWVV